jgi:hypothetical protein
MALTHAFSPQIATYGSAQIAIYGSAQIADLFAFGLGTGLQRKLGNGPTAMIGGREEGAPAK